VAVVSNPRPASRISNASSSLDDRRIVTEVASAYFATFWSASRHEKYTAASTCCGYRPTPSATMVSGTVVLRAWASRATARPWSARRGG
jgi:hypothetical protein